MTRLGLCGHNVTGTARYCAACAEARKRRSNHAAWQRWKDRTGARGDAKVCGACGRPMATSDRHLRCQQCRVAGAYSVTRVSTRQQAQPDDLPPAVIDRVFELSRERQRWHRWRAA